jgi:elongation factor G
MVDVRNIRNIAVAGHGKAGKTTLVEAMLFASGAIDRIGRVEDGSTVTDFEPEEIEKQISLSSSLAFCEHSDHRINIVDTPGFINFLEDTHGALKAVDGLVMLVSAVSGVKGETEKIWGFAKDMGLPCMIFMNKLDKEGADHGEALNSINQTFKIPPVAVQIPLGTGDNFKGVIDLLKMKAIVYDGNKSSEQDIPADMQELADSARNQLVEGVAENNDELLEKYLETGELSQEEVLSGLISGSHAHKFTVITYGDPHTGIGVKELMDTIDICMPSPADIAAINPIMGKSPDDESTEVERRPDTSEPFSAYVFKTLADPFAGKLTMFRIMSGTLNAETAVVNSVSGTKERLGQAFYLQGKNQVPAKEFGPGEIAVAAKLKGTGTGDTLSDENHKIVYDKVVLAEPLISYAIAPKTKGEEDKVSTGLHKILDEDPTLRFHRDEEAQEMILSGMGQVHLEITLEKLKRKFGADVEMKAPKIPYRETITKSSTAQGKYKKQSGGKGQYGDCHITIEPQPKGTGYEFVDKIVGGSIPKGYIPAVNKGIQEAMKAGPFAGFQMVDVKVTLFDGSYHAVDSSEMAFKIAGSMGLKKALDSAKPVILEPVMNVNITTPDEYMGTVMGDLNSRRGKVQGMDQIEGTTTQKVIAMVPMAEMLTYANQLHSMTAGRGVYHMEFSHYEELPVHMTQKLLEEREKEKEAKE